MTRKLCLVATALFWLAVLGIWAGGRRSPPPEPAAPVVATTRFALAEVARHTSSDDCWMVIDGRVYDLTAYLPEHPSRPGIILPWCGKDATDAYHTKNRGRPHSAEADLLLATYQIGFLDDRPK